MNRAEMEVMEMFGPEGNTDDYWLGTPSTRSIINTNSFLDEDQRGWRTAESALRDSADVEGPSDETLHLMRAPGKPEGGGIMGLDNEYAPVLAAIVAAGERALELERRSRRRR